MKRRLRGLSLTAIRFSSDAPVAPVVSATSFFVMRPARRLKAAPKPAAVEGVRFSPKWVASDRARLELSAKDYASLVGVSMLTIYNWEKGKGKPRAKALAAWADVRGIGKREALRRLELLG